MYVIQDITRWVEQNIGFSVEFQYKFYASVAVILILWFIRTVFVWTVFKRTKDISSRYWGGKVSRYIAMVIALLVLGWIWLENFHHYATIIGIASAGLAVALKDPISNLAGWFFIIGRKPFVLGDRIQIGENMGDVVDIGLFRFTIMEVGHWVGGDETTGRIVNIPNNLIHTQPVANYNIGFDYIWEEISVRVTFESDWESAKELLKKIAVKHADKLSQDAKRKIRRAAKDFMLTAPTLEPLVRTRVDDSGVLLILRYLVNPYDRRQIEEIIWEDILREFKVHPDIDFAYPTERRYNYATEGKTYSPGSIKKHHEDIHSKKTLSE